VDKVVNIAALDLSTLLYLVKYLKTNAKSHNPIILLILKLGQIIGEIEPDIVHFDIYSGSNDILI